MRVDAHSHMECTEVYRSLRVYVCECVLSTYRVVVKGGATLWVDHLLPVTDFTYQLSAVQQDL